MSEKDDADDRPYVFGIIVAICITVIIGMILTKMPSIINELKQPCTTESVK